MKEITKISIKNDNVSINYNIYANQEKDKSEVSFNSSDAPNPEFTKVLKSLDKFVIEILELPKEYIDGLDVTGVTIKHEEKGMGCCISAIKQLSTNPSPLCINTPYKPPLRSEDLNKEKYISSFLSMKLDKLQELANKYLNGEREQIDMFENEK